MAIKPQNAQQTPGPQAPSAPSDSAETQQSGAGQNDQHGKNENQGNDSKDNKDGPLAPVVKKGLTVISEAEHLAQFPRTDHYAVKNTLDRPLSVNLCGGRDEKMWTKDANGNDTIRQNIPDACRSCPGMHIHLNGLENQRVSVLMRDCLKSEQTLQLVNESRILKVKKLDAEGRVTDVVSKL